MRLVSVLFGLGGVLAAYLFGRELHGSRFGLTLAFLVAVARWHVNFSRIAMTGIDTSFFEFLTLYFLARLLRRGRLADALGVGLGLGFGLVFYTAFRLFVLTIVMAAAIGVVLWWPQLARSFSRGGWRSHMARLAVLGVAGWLVVMPMVQFALANPQAFWYRTNQISIFTKRDQANLGLALWQTTRQHLLMFNYQGDKNGRHNLPGEPMLDPLTGMLAVLGFALALARPRRPHHTFFLLLLPLGLVGGIFSVDFEAPQSLRSIAVFPAVMYFAALALAALGREAQESLAGVAPHWVTVPAAGLAGVMLFSNAHTYFIRQANDFASWNAFSAPETITGRKMAQLGPDTAYYLSPFLANHPTSRFIAPNITDQRALTLPDALPIRRPADRPAALFIHPDDVWVFDQAQQLYPNAAFEVARGRSTEDDAPPVVYMVILQPGDIAAVQGLELRYFSRDSAAADSPNQLPLLTVRAYAVNTTWPAESPVPGDFTAEWRGVLYAPQYGPYSFRLTTPGPATLEIDGNPVLEAQAGEHLVGLPLAEGNHAFRLRVQSGTGQVNLYWQPPGQAERLVPQWALYAPPVTNHGLLGSYYLNDRWEGQPAFQRVDPFLDMYFHFTPLPRPYTVAWEGMLDVPQSGLYRLGVRAVAEAQLFLDDQPALTTGQPDQTTETALTLNAGLHPIRLLFRDVTDRSRIHLLWATPATNLEPIPAQNLWPPLGRYPEKPASPPRADVKSLELRWLRSLGVPGAEPGQFFEPRDVAVLSTGHLVVADTVNRRVQLIDPQGTPLQTLTGSEFPFEEPLAVAVNSRDEILVLDSTLQWVYRYNAAGELLDRFGGPAAQLFHPRGLTVLADDRVVIADTGRSRLALFSPDGAQAGAIGGLGSGPGQFNEPIDALAGLQGAYFVAEAMNNRVQQVDAAGNHLGQWAIPPAYAFNGPHLAAGPDGSIFVTESQSRLLLRYAPDGSLLNQWTALGPVNLAAPVGIYVDTAANRLYLTDVWTHQVHIFEIAEQP
jgi:DNA-binding beta-propeller fold protein YncE